MYFFLKERNSKKPTPINLLYYCKDESNKNKLFKKSTGQKISPSNWDFENRMPKVLRGGSGAENNHIRIILQEKVKEIDDIVKSLELQKKPITKTNIKDFFNKDVIETKTEKGLSLSVNDFINSKNKSKGQSISWVHKYENLRNKLIMFDLYKNQIQKFDDFNEDWLDEYSGFLRELPKLLENKKYLQQVKELPYDIRLPKTPYNDNTLFRHINFLFTFLKWSKGKYHNLNLQETKNPIRKFKSDAVYHTEEELDALHNLKGLSKPLSNSRDVYLIGCYSGQRYGDYSIFENADVKNDMIINRNQKTRKISYIPLHDRLKELLDKHEWKLPKISPQRFRDNIKKVCEKAGIDRTIKKVNYVENKEVVTYYKKYELVGTHTARRTFVNLSIKKGMSYNVVCDICAITTKTLMTYIISSEDNIKEQTLNAWNTK